MPKTTDWSRVYQECQEHGVKVVARWMGMSYQRLVAELHHSGVAGTPGNPTRAEIIERCRAMQQSWDSDTRQSRWEAARVVYQR